MSLTNGDKKFMNKTFVEYCVQSLKGKFVAFINLSSNCRLINVHSSKEAREMVKDVTNNCGDILKKLLYIYETHMNVQHGV